MGYFEEGRKTKKVKLPSNPEFWVEVFTDIKWGESKHFLQMTEDGKIDMVTSADKFMLKLIKDWNLTGADDKPAPIDPEHIDLLDRDDALLLVKEAGGNMEAAEDAKKN